MKILLVEDDIFFQKFYGFKLQESKFEVVLASDGEEGLTKARKDHPDIMLLDLVMPRRDGFSVLEEMKKDPSLQNIPVLVFSTLGQDQDIERAKQLGARDYVNKTFFDFGKLLQKIQAVMNR